MTHTTALQATSQKMVVMQMQILLLEVVVVVMSAMALQMALRRLVLLHLPDGERFFESTELLVCEETSTPMG